MREVVLDTETTGLDPKQGHRVIEIGCVELINGAPTGHYYQTYINPMRDVPPEASAVSGISTEFLKPFPIFEAIVQDFLIFIQDARLVIHNAPFDIGFLNSELGRLGLPLFSLNETVDTLKIARRLFPGSPANLNALCKRFSIDLSKRDKHGALLDAKLLTKVYIELNGGRQRQLFQPHQGNNKPNEDNDNGKSDLVILHQCHTKLFPERSFSINTQEKEAHDVFVKRFQSS